MSQRVLLIDGDAPFGLEVAERFRSMGAVVETCTDGGSGLAAAERNRPDLILLSVELPGMNGFMVCKKLRKHPALANVPLMVLSSEATPETFENHRRLKVHADDYLHKPVDIATLVERAGQFLALPEPDGEDPLDLDSLEMSDDDLIIIESEPPVAPAQEVDAPPVSMPAVVSSGPMPETAVSMAPSSAGVSEGAFGALTGALSMPAQAPRVATGVAASLPVPSVPTRSFAPNGVLSMPPRPPAEVRGVPKPANGQMSQGPASMRPASAASEGPSEVEAALRHEVADLRNEAGRESRSRIRAEKELLEVRQALATAEAERAQADAAREQAEAERARADAAREQAEAERVQADAAREQAEAEREQLAVQQREAEESAASAQAARPSQVPGAPTTREMLGLREQLNGRDREILGLQEQLTEREKRRVEADERGLVLERRIADLEETVAATEADRQSLQQRLADAEARVTEGAAELTRVQQAHTAELEGVRQAHAEELTQLREQHASAMAEAQEHASQAQSEALAAAAASAEQLQAAALDSLRTELTEAAEAQDAQRVAAHQTEMARVGRALNDAQAHRENIEAALDEMRQKCEGVEGDLAERTRERDASEQLRAQLEARVERDDAIVERVQKAMAIGVGLLEERKRELGA